MPSLDWLAQSLRATIDRLLPPRIPAVEVAEWSRDRLIALLKERFSGIRLVVVANREPYMHVRDGENVRWIRPASGLVTALDPIMRATGGTWIAHGSGSGDADTADAHGHLQVPPNRPSYTLRRVWLTKEEEEGYYYGLIAARPPATSRAHTAGSRRRLAACASTRIAEAVPKRSRAARRSSSCRISLPCCRVSSNAGVPTRL